MFPRNENRNEGTFACSPGTKTGTRVRSRVHPERKTGTRARSPKPPFFYETALSSPSDRVCCATFRLEFIAFGGNFVLQRCREPPPCLKPLNLTALEGCFQAPAPRPGPEPHPSAETTRRCRERSFRTEPERYCNPPETCCRAPKPCNPVKVHCTVLVACVCGDPCRATRVAADFLRILGFCGCSSNIALHPPLKGPVAPVALELPGVSHVKLPLKRCRATRGVAATLAGVALHCATECTV